jgi:hypothetical protein
VSDPTLIAPIRHGARKQPTFTDRALRLSGRQQASIGRLVTAIKIHCEFLGAHCWQVEGKQRIVGHDGCGVRLIREATRLNNSLLRESPLLRHRRRKTSHPAA